ncbi:hypothetical protein L1278_001206 [Pontibacter sp. HSC-36F09]|nr:hypothetical protein [Pontibacter sp. HSC-36F09]
MTKDYLTKDKKYDGRYSQELALGTFLHNI